LQAIGNNGPGVATRRRLLDTAERLFAENGFSAVSLREIISKAGVNIGAVHYHFGSKHELFEQVLKRLAMPFYERVLGLLRDAEQWRDDPTYLARIIEALVIPTFKAPPGGAKGLRNFNRIRAHIFVSEQEFARQLLTRFLGPALNCAYAALRHALPELSPTELLWRLHLLRASLVLTTIPSNRFSPVRLAKYSPEDPNEAIAYLVPLTVEMFRTPALGPTMHVASARSQSRRNGKEREWQSETAIGSAGKVSRGRNGRRPPGPSRVKDSLSHQGSAS
jgi:AcrR family transcriptional regulator